MAESNSLVAALPIALAVADPFFDSKRFERLQAQRRERKEVQRIRREKRREWKPFRARLLYIEDCGSSKWYHFHCLNMDTGTTFEESGKLEYWMRAMKDSGVQSSSWKVHTDDIFRELVVERIAFIWTRDCSGWSPDRVHPNSSDRLSRAIHRLDCEAERQDPETPLTPEERRVRQELQLFRGTDECDE
jgi:hypothetical protein